jgi:D-arabinono-1,4-lactone oxidase
MPVQTIDKQSDGFYHPATEEELIALVKKAYTEGLQLRVRGSVHSVAHAIYTDSEPEVPNRVNVQSPPDSPNINVMLDRYSGFRVVDAERRLIEAQAGIHLGWDPSDPTHSSDEKNSLLWQLWNNHRWTIDNTGGISHQTVSGFTATGSSGGSLIYSSNDNLYGFRVIDGTGRVHEVNRDDNLDEFCALSPSLGLLGVVSTVTLRCVPAFNITGQEAITTYEDCSIDLFGTDTPGPEARPSLQEFLKCVEYSRFDWWPQPGCERIVLWQAQRIEPQLGFRPRRYEEFTKYPEIAEVVIYIFMTIIGNLDDVSRIKPMLQPVIDKLQPAIKVWLSSLQGTNEELVKRLIEAVEKDIDEFFIALQEFSGFIEKNLPEIFAFMVSRFMPLDSAAGGMQKGEPQSFRDWAWQGLPMDNQASDRLVATEFTEIWIPVQYSQQVMCLYRDYFQAGGNPHGILARTGTYTWEVYGAKPTPFWMNAAYTNGYDEWKDGVVRFDIFWFSNNPGDPAESFFPKYWRLLRDANIPFRLHWGKFQPNISKEDPEGWVEFFRKQYPRWDDFLALRTSMDPNNIFLTDYWRSIFGLWETPRPMPVAAGP